MLKFFKSFRKVEKSPPDPVQVTSVGPKHDPLPVEVSTVEWKFSSDHKGKRLQEMWKQYLHSGAEDDDAFKRSALYIAFLAQLEEYFADWNPAHVRREKAIDNSKSEPESKTVASTSTNISNPSSSRTVQVHESATLSHTLGHPRPVIDSLVFELRQEASVLSTMADSCRIDRRDSQRLSCLWRAISVLSRSRHNRWILFERGFLPLLHSHLNALAHIFSVMKTAASKAYFIDKSQFECVQSLLLPALETLRMFCATGALWRIENYLNRTIPFHLMAERKGKCSESNVKTVKESQFYKVLQDSHEVLDSHRLIMPECRRDGIQRSDNNDDDETKDKMLGEKECEIISGLTHCARVCLLLCEGGMVVAEPLLPDAMNRKDNPSIIASSKAAENSESSESERSKPSILFKNEESSSPYLLPLLLCLLDTIGATINCLGEDAQNLFSKRQLMNDNTNVSVPSSSSKSMLDSAIHGVSSSTTALLASAIPSFDNATPPTNTTSSPTTDRTHFKFSPTKPCNGLSLLVAFAQQADVSSDGDTRQTQLQRVAVGIESLMLFHEIVKQNNTALSIALRNRTATGIVRGIFASSLPLILPCNVKNKTVSAISIKTICPHVYRLIYGGVGDANDRPELYLSSQSELRLPKYGLSVDLVPKEEKIVNENDSLDEEVSLSALEKALVHSENIALPVIFALLFQVCKLSYNGDLKGRSGGELSLNRFLVLEEILMLFSEPLFIRQCSQRQDSIMLRLMMIQLLSKLGPIVPSKLLKSLNNGLYGFTVAASEADRIFGCSSLATGFIPPTGNYSKREMQHTHEHSSLTLPSGNTFPIEPISSPDRKSREMAPEYIGLSQRERARIFGFAEDDKQKLVKKTIPRLASVASLGCTISYDDSASFTEGGQENEGMKINCIEGSEKNILQKDEAVEADSSFVVSVDRISERFGGKSDASIRDNLNRKTSVGDKSHRKTSAGDSFSDVYMLQCPPEITEKDYMDAAVTILLRSRVFSFLEAYVITQLDTRKNVEKEIEQCNVEDETIHTHLKGKMKNCSLAVKNAVETLLLSITNDAERDDVVVMSCSFLRHLLMYAPKEVGEAMQALDASTCLFSVASAQRERHTNKFRRKNHRPSCDLPSQVASVPSTGFEDNNVNNLNNESSTAISAGWTSGMASAIGGTSLNITIDTDYFSPSFQRENENRVHMSISRPTMVKRLWDTEEEPTILQNKDSENISLVQEEKKATKIVREISVSESEDSVSSCGENIIPQNFSKSSSGSNAYMQLLIDDTNESNEKSWMMENALLWPAHVAVLSVLDFYLKHNAVACVRTLWKQQEVDSGTAMQRGAVAAFGMNNTMKSAMTSIDLLFAMIHDSQTSEIALSMLLHLLFIATQPPLSETEAKTVATERDKASLTVTTATSLTYAAAMANAERTLVMRYCEEMHAVQEKGSRLILLYMIAGIRSLLVKYHPMKGLGSEVSVAHRKLLRNRSKFQKERDAEVTKRRTKLWLGAHVYVHLATIAASEMKQGSLDHARLFREILATFMVLLRGSRSAKTQFESDVGYRRLRVLLLKAEPNPSPSLCAMLVRMQDDAAARVCHVGVIPLILKLLPHIADVKQQLAIVSALKKSLFGSRSAPNMSECSRVEPPLVGQIIDILGRLKPLVQSAIVLGMLKGIGSYMITTSQLKRILQLMQHKGQTQSALAPVLMKALQSMIQMRHDGPQHWFELDGVLSGLQLSYIEGSTWQDVEKIVDATLGLPCWPARGYSLVFWLRIENMKTMQTDSDGDETVYNEEKKTSNSKEEKTKRSSVDGRQILFSCGDEAGHGLEIFIKALRIGVRVVSPENDIILLSSLETALRESHWNHVAVVHSKARLMGTQGGHVCVYINSELIWRVAMPYPMMASRVPFCVIGCGLARRLMKKVKGKADSSHSKSKNSKQAYRSLRLRGQLGCVYLFGDELSKREVQELQHSEVEGACARWMLREKTGELGAKLLLSLSPARMRRDGREFPDSSPDVSRWKRWKMARPAAGGVSEHVKGGEGVLVLTATGGEGAHSVPWRSPHEVMECVGGLRTLFPLFVQLDLKIARKMEIVEEEKSFCPDPERLLDMFGLFAAVLSRCRGSVEFMLDAPAHGLAVISYLIERVSPYHLDGRVLHSLEKLSKHLEDEQPRSRHDEIKIAVYQKILGNLRIWAYTTAEVQLELLDMLEAVCVPELSVGMRKDDNDSLEGKVEKSGRPRADSTRVVAGFDTNTKKTLRYVVGRSVIAPQQLLDALSDLYSYNDETVTERMRKELTRKVHAWIAAGACLSEKKRRNRPGDFDGEENKEDGSAENSDSTEEIEVDFLVDFALQRGLEHLPAGDIYHRFVESKIAKAEAALMTPGGSRVNSQGDETGRAAFVNIAGLVPIDQPAAQKLHPESGEVVGSLPMGPSLWKIRKRLLHLLRDRLFDLTMSHGDVAKETEEDTKACLGFFSRCHCPKERSEVIDVLLERICGETENGFENLENQENRLADLPENRWETEDKIRSRVFCESLVNVVNTVMSQEDGQDEDNFEEKESRQFYGIDPLLGLLRSSSANVREAALQIIGFVMRTCKEVDMKQESRLAAWRKKELQRAKKQSRDLFSRRVPKEELDPKPNTPWLVNACVIGPLISWNASDAITPRKVIREKKEASLTISHGGDEFCRLLSVVENELMQFEIEKYTDYAESTAMALLAMSLGTTVHKISNLSTKTTYVVENSSVIPVLLRLLRLKESKLRCKVLEMLTFLYCGDNSVVKRNREMLLRQSEWQRPLLALWLHCNDATVVQFVGLLLNSFLHHAVTSGVGQRHASPRAVSLQSSRAGHGNADGMRTLESVVTQMYGLTMKRNEKLLSENNEVLENKNTDDEDSSTSLYLSTGMVDAIRIEASFLCKFVTTLLKWAQENESRRSREREKVSDESESSILQLSVESERRISGEFVLALSKEIESVATTLSILKGPLGPRSEEISHLLDASFWYEGDYLRCALVESFLQLLIHVRVSDDSLMESRNPIYQQRRVERDVGMQLMQVALRLSLLALEPSLTSQQTTLYIRTESSDPKATWSALPDLPVKKKISLKTDGCKGRIVWCLTQIVRDRAFPKSNATMGINIVSRFIQLDISKIDFGYPELRSAVSDLLGSAVPSKQSVVRDVLYSYLISGGGNNSRNNGTDLKDKEGEEQDNVIEEFSKEVCEAIIKSLGFAPPKATRTNDNNDNWFWARWYEGLNSQLSEEQRMRKKALHRLLVRRDGREGTLALLHAKNVATIQYVKTRCSRISQCLSTFRQSEQRRMWQRSAESTQASRSASEAWHRILNSVAHERGLWGSGKEEGSSSHRDDTKLKFWRLANASGWNLAKRPLLERNWMGSSYKKASVWLYEGLGEEAAAKKLAVSEDRGNDVGKYVNTSERIGLLDDFEKTLFLARREKGVGEDAEDGISGIGDVDNVITENGKSYDIECEWITPMTVTAGRLLLCKGEGLIRFVPNPVSETSPDKSRHPRLGYEKAELAQPMGAEKWEISALSAVELRRYQMREVALELFWIGTERNSAFFNFKTKKSRIRVYRRLRECKPSRVTDWPDSRSTFAQRLAATKLIQQWQNREITNFDFLLRLNFAAGRTYQDLAQYPIMPWVLSNYESASLDLRDAKVYRDLSKPVGAQTEKRRLHFKKRYEECLQLYDDAKRMGENDAYTPIPRHFACHYSNPQIVLWYLIRLEPFTRMHIQLQDGRFDQPDRQFFSMASAWRGVQENDADVKEMIPELFFLPECLENGSKLDLGNRQFDKKKISDVELPPWADGSAEKFVRAHRAALESEHVSAHLHEWVDLIFGYKQRGPFLPGGSEEAVKAFNVYASVTYEGAGGEPLEAVRAKDPTRFEMMLSMRDNFGQCPPVLLTEPCPRRKSLWETELIYPLFSPLCGSASAPQPPPQPRHVLCNNGEKLSSSALAYVLCCPGRVITLDASGLIAMHIWEVDPQVASINPSKLICGNDVDAVPTVPFDCRKVDFTNPRRVVSVLFAAEAEFDASGSSGAGLSLRNNTSSTGPIAGRWLISGGHWDRRFRVTDTSTGKVVQVLSGHRDIVTCVALSEDGETLVTGSADGSV
eukprot:g4237.t1